VAQEALAAQALRLDEATWQAIAAAAGDKNDKDSRPS
jgi:hypothetical protein